MPPGDSNVWHQVHAQREDGVAAMFLIRDVVPRADQPRIFVVELPYPVTDLSGQPDAAAYRRLGTFQEQWVEPACTALGWTFVAWKSEDGSFFLYLYGAGDPELLLEKLAPFDGELGFFNDVDADWSEYAALRELVEQSRDDGFDGTFDDDDDDDESESGGDGDDHVHTADRGHDHAAHQNGHHGKTRGSAHDPDATVRGIRVIDLTQESPLTMVSLMDTPKRADRNDASAAYPEVMYEAEADDLGDSDGDDAIEASDTPSARSAPRKPRAAAAAGKSKRVAASTGRPPKRPAASQPKRNAAAAAGRKPHPAAATASSKPKQTAAIASSKPNRATAAATASSKPKQTAAIASSKPNRATAAATSKPNRAAATSKPKQTAATASSKPNRAAAAASKPNRAAAAPASKPKRTIASAPSKRSAPGRSSIGRRR